MAKNTPLTEFDLITLNPLMQVVKAVIPFLDLQTQKTFSFMIRFNEFQQTMHFFNSLHGKNPFSTYSKCSATPIRSLNDIITNDEILDTIVKYCPENYASMINSYRQFSKMSQMFDIFNTSSEKTDNPLNNLSGLFGSSNPFQAFDNASDKKSNDSTTSFMNNIMNDKQQAMYEQYMKELDGLDFNNINL